jgi:tetratricopeptide (TPR) repeat protein
MNLQVQELTCPGCGDRLAPNQVECKYCRKPIYISSLSDITQFTNVSLSNFVKSYDEIITKDSSDHIAAHSMGMCFLGLKQYDKAIIFFEKAINLDPNSSDSYFFNGISYLKGLKPFVHLRDVIDKIEEQINTALMIEEKAIYYYYLAFIKYDYFSRKFFNTTPDYITALQRAKDKGLNEAEIQNLFSLLQLERPLCL